MEDIRVTLSRLEGKIEALALAGCDRVSVPGWRPPDRSDMRVVSLFFDPSNSIQAIPANPMRRYLYWPIQSGIYIALKWFDNVNVWDSIPLSQAPIEFFYARQPALCTASWYVSVPNAATPVIYVEELEA